MQRATMHGEVETGIPFAFCLRQEPNRIASPAQLVPAMFFPGGLTFSREESMFRTERRARAKDREQKSSGRPEKMRWFILDDAWSVYRQNSREEGRWDWLGQSSGTWNAQLRCLDFILPAKSHRRISLKVRFTRVQLHTVKFTLYRNIIPWVLTNACDHVMTKVGEM